MGLGGGSPKLFEGHRDLDAIGCLGCVEVDVGGFGGRRLVGGDLLGQLIETAQYRYFMRCKSEKQVEGACMMILFCYIGTLWISNKYDAPLRPHHEAQRPG